MSSIEFYFRATLGIMAAAIGLAPIMFVLGIGLIQKWQGGDNE